jgi:hypothetical protein
MAVLLFLLGLLATGNQTAWAGFRVIQEFDGIHGASPYGHLISADNRLYGMTAGDTY